MSDASFLSRHARTLLLFALALAVAGAVAAWSLPVGLFPQVAFPRIVVDLDAGDRPADTMALLVTRPVEEAIRTVPGVEGVRSETSRGAAQVSVDFGWGRDMIASTLLVDAAITRAVSSLPPGVTYDVRRMDPTVFPIVSYALRSDSISPARLRDLAQFRIAPALASVSGLSRVAVQGGDTPEIQVEADPRQLAAHGLAFDDLVGAIAGANVVRAVGRVQDRNKLFLTLVDQSMQGTRDIGAIVVRRTDAGWVHVSDVATVRMGVEPQWTRIAEDGRPAVLFNVFEQPDGNAVAIAGEVRARLARLALPPGVTLRKWYDQSELVTDAAASVRDAIAIGLLLAALVLWGFLRSGRIVGIALVVVPATLAVTVLLLRAMGMSFNIMTLGGMAAAVGLVIDDVMVMVEHLAHRASRVAEGDVASGMFASAREFLPPLSGSSAATLIVFVPLAYLDGVTGAFSRALSITMACALAVSWAMTAFIVPYLTSRWLDVSRWRDPAAGRARGLARWHGTAYRASVRRPWLPALAIVALLAAGLFAATQVPTGFMPDADESGFVLDYYTAPGTSLSESERQVAQIETILRARRDVETFSRRLGTGLGGDLGQSHHGDMFVRLVSDHDLPTRDVMDDVRESILRNVPGVEVETAQLMEDLIGDLTAVPQPIEVKLYGDDETVLRATATRVADKLVHTDGLVEVRSGVRIAGDALDIRLDHDAAAAEGVSADLVARTVSDALDGVVATSLPMATRAVGVRVSVPGARHWRIADLADVPVRAPDGHVLPLRRVATLIPVSGQAQITREDLQTMVPVTARIDRGGMDAAVARVKAVLAQPGVLPAGTRYELGGLYAQQQTAFAGLRKVFAAAILAEFLLLMLLYRSMWLSALVMTGSLLSASGVFLALWLTGVDLNVTAMMGLTMVVGIGTEMAIFLVSEYVARRRTATTVAALRRAVRLRVRPISMTSFAAILTLLPLALAIGRGSGIQQPLAIAIVGGLIVQYPLVLLGLPVAIGAVERWRAQTSNRHPTDSKA
ncbi:efflux RND transporter permease subunit [Luteibacter sp. 22Crub2.1]|uniref:efflux RND transporter permease subunit n=1 Tax=Luteibacter sp. 22Crub2.1 TaxID=1283288 RepID=UPI0009A71925|nr:efflux RND transporter permease subunit [Luteibacter sp. 22Crub2.1]SKB95979.1 Multidrug efflux pump subunit AcrB [Luteibacter sp. 22Crub2.1]